MYVWIGVNGVFWFCLLILHRRKRLYGGKHAALFEGDELCFCGSVLCVFGLRHQLGFTDH